MELDEAGTLTALKAHREELIDPTIAEHRGRIVKLMGDGALVEFASVVDAVTCAAAIQKGMTGRNDSVAEDRHFELRIGVHLGDIIVEGEDIYGEGVNVAARLEGLAEPGGVCLSGDAYRQVRGKVEVDFEDLGEREVKNLVEPLRVYRIAINGPSPAPTLTPTKPLPLPDKPSIAVLPFDNMSGDSEQTYFADGITEDIITELSRYSDLMVIARNSSFAYKGRTVDPKTIMAELGVRYILEGSVRKAGSRIRVTAQLIDGAHGGHLWAERFDRNLEDIFAVQDEITQIVVGTLVPKLQAARANLVMNEDPARLNAYDLVLRALAHYRRFTKADHEETGRLARAAIKIDSLYSRAYSVLALNLMQSRNSGYTRDPEACLAAGLEAARMAVSLDDNDGQAHAALAMLYLFSDRHQQSITESRRAIELNPNFADGHAHLANALACSGQTAEALTELDMAMRLNPHYPAYYLMMQGRTHFVQGDYQAAIAPLERAVNVNPGFTPARTTLATCYAATGRVEEAKAVIADLLSEVPDLTVTYVRDVTPFKDPETLQRFVTCLETAGLPE
jgi:TolB-like protein/Flp pilus assembly protein TadD